MNELTEFARARRRAALSKGEYFQTGRSVHDVRGRDNRSIISGGKMMRKGAFLLALLMVASASTTALAAKKKAAPAKPAPVAADPNEPGRRFVTNAFNQIFVPWQSMAQKK